MRTLPSPHIEVAAYVLGVLDEDDNEAFETHLTGCTHCQSELRGLFGLPDLLDEVVKGPKPRDRVLARLLDDVGVARRIKRTRTHLLTAAAAVTVLVTPVITAAVQPEPTDPARSPVSTESRLLPAPETLKATDQASRMTAEITLSPQSWGTQVALELSGITGPEDCELVAVTRSGEDVVVTTWHVPAKRSYGPPGSSDPLRIVSGTALARGEILAFEVRGDAAGSRLVSVPA